ncbi:MAG TPA: CaiB/BaiF CoA-transferase family protein [Burkholderiales bacterium]|nr:CaiB/BaiF CoA-transferase family protein [Burkholderiales bacterium]
MKISRCKPLEGIRVLDLTRLLPGPMCTLHLADMGADVIKIEDTGDGDYARKIGTRNADNSLFFLALNRNKRGVRLDLKQPRGREVFLKLTERADLIVESFRPGVMDKLGIGYHAVSARSPRIVYCSISGYGQTGPYRDRAGHDINYLGYAGVLNDIGKESPIVPNYQIADTLGGALTGAMGILAALLDAKTSGRGRYVDVSMTDSVLAHALLALVTLKEGGEAPPRGESPLSGGLPWYNVYETSDRRYLALGALEKKFWDKLCEALGRPDLKDRHGSAGEAAAALEREVASIFRTQPLVYWTNKLVARDCCASPVLTLAEALEDEQVKSREMVVESSHPVDGKVTQFALPIKFSEFEFEVARPAPMPGEHSEEVLREAGYTAQEIGALRDRGVI